MGHTSHLSPGHHQSHTHMSCARAFASSRASTAGEGVVSPEEAMLAGPLTVCLLENLWVLNARPRLRFVQTPRTRWVDKRVQCIQ